MTTFVVVTRDGFNAPDLIGPFSTETELVEFLECHELEHLLWTLREAHGGYIAAHDLTPMSAAEFQNDHHEWCEDEEN